MAKRKTKCCVQKCQAKNVDINLILPAIRFGWFWNCYICLLPLGKIQTFLTCAKMQFHTHNMFLGVMPLFPFTNSHVKYMYLLGFPICTFCTSTRLSLHISQSVWCPTQHGTNNTQWKQKYNQTEQIHLKWFIHSLLFRASHCLLPISINFSQSSWTAPPTLCVTVKFFQIKNYKNSDVWHITFNSGFLHSLAYSLTCLFFIFLRLYLLHHRRAGLAHRKQHWKIEEYGNKKCVCGHKTFLFLCLYVYAYSSIFVFTPIDCSMQRIYSYVYHFILINEPYFRSKFLREIYIFNILCCSSISFSGRFGCMRESWIRQQTGG